MILSENLPEVLLPEMREKLLTELRKAQKSVISMIDVSKLKKTKVSKSKSKSPKKDISSQQEQENSVSQKIELTDIAKMTIPVLHSRTIGLDVHQSSITACALIDHGDGTGSIILRQFGAFQRDLRELSEWLVELRPEAVTMESSGIYWKSVYAALERAGIRSQVVNARHVKNVPGRKTDVSDALWLAMLTRAGLLRASFVPPAKFRELRIVSRERQNLVQDLSRAKNRMHKILTDSGVRLQTVVSDIYGVTARMMIKAIIANNYPALYDIVKSPQNRLKAEPEVLLDSVRGEFTNAHRFVLGKLMEQIEQLEDRIQYFENYLLENLKEETAYLNLLQTIPGVNLMGAALLLVEIGTDMSVFGSADKLASWAGVCPGNNESAGKRLSGRTRKGNQYVRRLLCEFAHAASRTATSFKSKYQALVQRRGYKRSIIAIAHKLLRTIFVMLKTGEYYRDSQVDYQKLSVEKNAARWFKALIEYGYITPLPKDTSVQACNA